MTTTVRVLPAEEIAARAGGSTTHLRWPDRASLFAERQMRLQQLAAGHPMAEFLRFAAALCAAQQAELQQLPEPPLPDDAALARAAHDGVPPLPAAVWPRDAAWRAVLRNLTNRLRAEAPAGVRDALDALDAMDDAALERQADALLSQDLKDLDLATAPLVGAALQVWWVQLVAAVRARHDADHDTRSGHSPAPFGRIDDPAACPCCGSRPTASVTVATGESTGQRYLHCSLCNTQWYLERIQCAHCGSTEGIAYQSLDIAGGGAASASSASAMPTRATQAAIQAETCDRCGRYLKIMHRDRDPFVEPVADDLASLTLDLLVSDTGAVRHGVNLLLLFGTDEATAATPPEDG